MKAIFQPGWPRGELVVCIASGPSLKAEDVEMCRGLARVICVNDTFRLAPWADALYASDARWWGHKSNRDASDFAGLKIAQDHEGVSKCASIDVVLHRTGNEGFDPDPRNIRTGYNSGYAALHCALHAWPARVVLIGYDMKAESIARSHFFGSHPPDLQRNAPFGLFLSAFPSIITAAAARGTQIVNATRDTALTVFPRVDLQEALRAPSLAL